MQDETSTDGEKSPRQVLKYKALYEDTLQALQDTQHRQQVMEAYIRELEAQLMQRQEVIDLQRDLLAMLKQRTGLGSGMSLNQGREVIIEQR